MPPQWPIPESRDTSQQVDVKRRDGFAEPIRDKATSFSLGTPNHLCSYVSQGCMNKQHGCRQIFFFQCFSFYHHLDQKQPQPSSLQPCIPLLAEIPTHPTNGKVARTRAHHSSAINHGNRILNPQDAHLGGSHQLGRAGSDFMGADNQLFIFACLQDNSVCRLPAVGREIALQMHYKWVMCIPPHP